MTITVVIPAHNEAEYIGPLLVSLLQQTRLPDEIIVVCDNCTDDTAERARLFFTDFPKATHCQTIAVRVGDIAGARNAGIRATTGDILVCVDADTCLHPMVLESVERATNNGVVLGGFQMIADCRFQRSFYETLLCRLWIGSINFCAAILRNFVGTGCFFRRDLGLLYDENWGWGEDIEFCGRVKRQGKCKTAYITEASLVYCDRRFLERGYTRELIRRLHNGIDHLWRTVAMRRKNFA